MTVINKVLVVSILPTFFASLVGCVNYIGINSNKKIAPPNQFQTTKSLPQQHGKWPDADWAKQFGDPQLEALIAEALANNPNLEVAKARIVQARAMVDKNESALYPNVGLLDAVDRVRLSSHNLFLGPISNSIFTQEFFLASLSYTLDIWGKNMANLRLAISQEKASEAALQESRLSIAASVASTYNQLAYYYSLRDILKRTLAQREEIDKITKVRLRNGLDSKTQLYQSANAQATVRTKLVAVEGQILITKQQLGTLVGGGPDRGLTIKHPHLSIPKTSALPDNLPFNLLGRRPDIVGARWQVEAACQGINFVKAQFYPNINLKAGIGFISFALTHLDIRANAEYIGPAISLPLFDAGALRAQLRNQFGKYEEAVANYNVTLSNALADVVNQITTIQSIEKQLKSRWEAYTAAKQAYELANYQYRAGLTSQLVVLNTETNYLDEQQTRLELITNRRNLQIALTKALGGGFEETMLCCQKPANK